jgi:hypothetical protein
LAAADIRQLEGANGLLSCPRSTGMKSIGKWAPARTPLASRPAKKNAGRSGRRPPVRGGRLCGASKPVGAWATTAKCSWALNVRPSRLPPPFHGHPLLTARRRTSTTCAMLQTPKPNPSSCCTARSSEPVSFCSHTKVSF